MTVHKQIKINKARDAISYAWEMACLRDGIDPYPDETPRWTVFSRGNPWQYLLDWAHDKMAKVKRT